MDSPSRSMNVMLMVGFCLWGEASIREYHTQGRTRCTSSTCQEQRLCGRYLWLHGETGYDQGMRSKASAQPVDGTLSTAA